MDELHYQLLDLVGHWRSDFFFNWYSLHVRLNSHYEVWSYKKKKHKKDYSIQEICLERMCRMSVNSRLKATKIIGQRKTFDRQRIPEPTSARKETVDIDILVASRNGGRKIMQFIRITSRPTSRKRKWNQLSEFWRTSTKIRPIEKTSWPHFDDDPRVQEKQQVKGQQSCIFVFEVCLTIPTRGTSPDVTTVFHTWAYGRFIDIQSNLRRKKLHRMN